MTENELQRNPSPAQRLISPYIRVQIGRDVFVIGDGLLKDCKVTLGEGANLNNCSFSIFDPNKAFADRYFTTIFKSGGLTPLNIPSSSGGSGSAGQASDQGISSIYEVAPETISRAVQFFVSQGITVKGAAYLVGSALQESRLDPTAGNGPAHGIFQWISPRDAGLPSDLDGQLKFAISDIEGDYSGIMPTLKDPNATSADLAAAIASWERYGSNEEGSRFKYAEQLYQMLTSSDSKDKAQQTVQTPKKELPPAIKESVTGQQITIELGFGGEMISATSYLHTSLDFDLFDPNKLSFGGQAATWVLTQRKKNTAYTNMTLRQIAQKICDGYGIKLEMEEDGPEYEFFPQRGKSDYEALLTECRRIGYRVHSRGNTLSLKPRSTDKNGFVLEFGENLGTTFKVSHQAQGDSAGGARASAPSSGTTTGERKWSLDPATGEISQDRLENETGTGSDATATTGSQTIQVAPGGLQVNNTPSTRDNRDIPFR